MSNELNIEKGVPVKKKCTKWGHVREALKKMEPGDSFEIQASGAAIGSVADAMCVKVTIRSVEGKPGFIRVWRRAENEALPAPTVHGFRLDD